MVEAHKAHLIDLSVDDSPCGGSGTETPTTKRSKIKSEPAEQNQVECAAEENASPELENDASAVTQIPKPPTARSLAKQFRVDLQKRRDKKKNTRKEQRRPQKQLARKARGPPKRRKRKRTVDPPADPPADKRDPPADPPADKRLRTRRTRRTRRSSAVEDAPTTTPLKTFLYPLGTKVARDFDGQLFVGEISKLYSDEANVCEVTYTDGDKEDMDTEQVEYGTKLHKLNF